MKVAIVCVGSRGDVQPYTALAHGLRGRGYAVTVATHSEFKDLVLGAGVEFSCVEGNPREILKSEKGRQWIESNQNPLAFFAGLIRLSRSFFKELTRDTENGCKNAEAIIYSPLALCAHSVAEKLKIPSCMAPLQPVTPSTAFASPMFPPIDAGKAYNVLTHKAARQLIWQPFRSLFNSWRRNDLNLPPYGFWGPLVDFQQLNYPMLHAFSETIVPRPNDWSSRSHITGYWFANHGLGWTPSPPLSNFLSAGEAPVYIGFGSMSERDPKGLSRLLVQALKRAGRRAVLLSGWAELSKDELAEEFVHVVDAVPHDWLFPKMAAVIHHGGAGTTGEVLRAGVPNIVIPFFGDQHFWGQRVYQLGMGPKPIPRKRLTAESLAEAIRFAVNDQGGRERAILISDRIRKEDGVQRAIDILESEVWGL